MSSLARATRGDRGYSLVELLVSTGLLVMVTGGIFGLLDPARGTYRAQPEVTDVQQRLRAVVETLRHDLVMAGAGAYQGTDGGPLLYWFAPLQPGSVGRMGAPGPRAIAITYVPETSAQATIADDLAAGGTEVRVQAQPGCPAADAACGFEAGMRALVFDASGAYDVFAVTAVHGAVLQVEHGDGPAAAAHPAGSHIAAVTSHRYFLDEAEHRLYRDEAGQSRQPVADNVADLRFEYFGDPKAPVLRRPVTEPGGPWTTYGPRPPPPGIDDPEDDWGPGENCILRLADGQHVPRLPDLSGGDAPGALVPVPIASFTDGPWCPGLSSAGGLEVSNRFDADLLRVRRVRVTVRVQAGSESLRGQNPAGRTLFANPGTSRSGNAMVPDQEIRFEVTPRNLDVGR